MTRDNFLRFMHKADKYFPIHLSSKTDLEQYAEKLWNNATFVSVEEGGEIQALLAGYTNSGTPAYISMVAVVPEKRHRGLGTYLVRQFQNICRGKGIRAVHLYTFPGNAHAIHMYEEAGFVRYTPENEIRPEDTHLICYL